MAATKPTSPGTARSGRGRPPKLTAERIVGAARELLSSRVADEVTFALVAQQLGTPSSSVYNYFPNREALFAAVAAEVFASFDFVDPGDAAPWQERLRGWLAAVDRFFARHPIAFRVMATSGHASPAWIHVRAPLLRVLGFLGFAGRDLALVHAWFEEQVTGLLLLEYHAGRSRPDADGPDRVVLDIDDEAMRDDLERRKHLPSIRREEIIGIGFDAVTAAVERLATDHGRRKDAASVRPKRSAPPNG